MCNGLSGTSKSLITSAVLFFTITGFQYVASLPAFANSLALRADCLSMFVDGLSYLGNLAAECNPNPRTKKQVELTVAGLSLTLLLGFTLVFFFDAAGEILEPKKEASEVDARIVLAFALLGLLFDTVSITAFFFWAETPLLTTEQTSDEETEEHDTAKDLNVLSALLHIGSDLLRSLTTFVEAIIILSWPKFGSEKVDGWSALIVCFIIAVTAIGALFKWVKELQAHIDTDEAKQKYEYIPQADADEKEASKMHILQI